jgi:hypothetical protein
MDDTTSYEFDVYITHAEWCLCLLQNGLFRPFALKGWGYSWPLKPNFSSLSCERAWIWEVCLVCWTRWGVKTWRGKRLITFKVGLEGSRVAPTLQRERYHLNRHDHHPCSTVTITQLNRLSSTNIFTNKDTFYEHVSGAGNLLFSVALGFIEHNFPTFYHKSLALNISTTSTRSDMGKLVCDKYPFVPMHSLTFF